MIPSSSPVALSLGYSKEEEAIVFETETNVLFSNIQGQLGLALQWRGWKSRHIVIRRNGLMMYSTSKETSSISGFYNLHKVRVTEMEDNSTAAAAVDGREEEKVQNENGIICKCCTVEGSETYFRCIMTDDDLRSFKAALRIVSLDHNVDNLKRSDLTKHIRKATSQGTLRKVLHDAGIRSGQSAMRRSVARAMDCYDQRSIADRTVQRRGAFRFMPVLFANDLVHGSWWLTVGSILYCISSGVILWNTASKALGEDDSRLNDFQFRATWVLMIISGVFAALGSMAFMRAVHEDPPMKPLFEWMAPHLPHLFYHIQSDELLGSWLFLLSALPIVPFSLIYLKTSYRNLLYVVAVVCSILLNIGSFLFVSSCYPSTKPRRKLVQPIAFCLCACLCSKWWMRRHLNNDWLAGTWFVFWGTLLATVVCIGLLILSLMEGNPLQLFNYSTGLIETLCFLIGSTYFVCGSYDDIDIVNELNDTEWEEQRAFFSMDRSSLDGSACSSVSVDPRPLLGDNAGAAGGFTTVDGARRRTSLEANQPNSQLLDCDYIVVNY